MDVQCFFLEKTNLFRQSLRRYTTGHGSGFGRCEWGHDASQIIVPQIEMADTAADEIPHDDPRYPKKCEFCEYEFRDSGAWQLFTERLYKRSGTGELIPLRSAPAGALYYADWLEGEAGGWAGPDGHVLYAVCPGGHWNIDGRASNCTMPKDDNHRCWTRTGTVPNITVGKQFGPTCGAGAGSIRAGNYHGFLRNGKFTT